MKSHAFLALFFAALSGCAMVGPDYERPQVGIPGQYHESAPEGAALPAMPEQWWRLYGDPVLDRLVSSGLEHNADTRIAAARLEEAEAALREARATYGFPLVELNTGASRAKSINRASSAAGSGGSSVRNDFQFGASTSFEIDFWGRLRRANLAAREQYFASRYGRDVVTLTLIAVIAQSYFAVRSVDAQLLTSAEALQAADESLVLVQKRAQAGLVSDLDVYQTNSLRAQTAAQVKELRRQRAVNLHQLGQLSGIPDLDLVAGDLRNVPTPPLPPAGLPSSLIERRPDVREAEAKLAAATHLIGVEKAAQFPTVRLTGAFGGQSDELNKLFSADSGVWSIGLGLVAPIFDAGRFAARTDQAAARARQAAAAYDKVVENAFREVSDSLSNVRLAADTEQDLAERVDQARKTLRLAQLRYQSGYSAYLEVLDAQRNHNDAQLAYVRNRQQYLGYTVDLMRSLGGGWTDLTGK